MRIRSSLAGVFTLIITVMLTSSCLDEGACDGPECGGRVNYCTQCRTDADCSPMYAGMPYAQNPRCHEDGMCIYDECSSDLDCQWMLNATSAATYTECESGSRGNYCTSCRNDEDCVAYLTGFTNILNPHCTADRTCTWDYCETDADCRDLFAGTPAASFTVCMHDDLSNWCSACRNDDDCQSYLDQYPNATTATCTGNLTCIIVDAACATDSDCRTAGDNNDFSECRARYM